MSIHSFPFPADELQMAYCKCLVVSVLVNTIDDVWGLSRKT